MIFFSSQSLVDKIIEDIDKSKSSIEIEVYIWDPDKIGKRFGDALVRASNRGVKVRVIVDRVGSLSWIVKQLDTLKQNMVDIRVFRPLPKLKSYTKYYLNNFFPFLSTFNRRDHRKIFIIDDEIAYVGSLNILEPAIKWKETTVRVTRHEDIKVISEIFECTWDWIEDDISRFAPCDFRKVIGDVLNSKNIRTTQTKKLRIHYRNDFIQRILSAKERVWLMTPYFNPPRFLLKALVEAKKRGIDVRLIIPKKTDPSWFQVLSRLYYSPLIKKGLRIYEYNKGVLHSKTALIDSHGIVGSGNLNYRSFYRDLELNMIIDDSNEVESLEKEYLRDMAQAHELKRPQEMKIWERIFGSFLTIFKTSF